MHILKLEKQKKKSFVQSAFKRNKIRCLKMIRAKKNTLLFQEALQNTYGLHFSNVYHRNKKKKILCRMCF